MANKREFKKNLDAVGASVCAPMFDAFYNADPKDQEKLDVIISNVIGAIGAAKANADITFDKGVKAFENLKEYSKAKKDFYKKLFNKINTEFIAEIEKALNEFNAILPQDVKQENKETAAR